MHDAVGFCLGRGGGWLEDRVATMKCDRCGGLRLWSHFANLGSAVGAWAYDGWRCMNCGDIVDAVILENRSLQQTLISTAHRARPYEGRVIWLRSRQERLADDRQSSARSCAAADDGMPRRRQAAG
jgi:hypothetical protein